MRAGGDIGENFHIYDSAVIIELKRSTSHIIELRYVSIRGPSSVETRQRIEVV
jgi:hypothetical protein